MARMKAKADNGKMIFVGSIILPKEYSVKQKAKYSHRRKIESKIETAFNKAIIEQLNKAFK